MTTPAQKKRQREKVEVLYRRRRTIEGGPIQSHFEGSYARLGGFGNTYKLVWRPMIELQHGDWEKVV